MTTTFQAGQKVRLTRGDEALNGEVLGNEYIEVGWEAAPSGAWVRRGFEVAVVEPPTPEPQPLPTEPMMVFLDKDHDLWRTNRRGSLYRVEGREDWPGGDTGVHRFAPFTALGSLKDHAEVIANAPFVDSATANRIRREFGEASE